MSYPSEPNDDNLQKENQKDIQKDDQDDFYQPATKKKRISQVGGCFGRLKFYLKVALVEMRKRCCFFCIGVFSIILCIVTSMIAQGVIDKTPLIFYNSAAVSNGEIDIIITPDDSNGQFSPPNPTLNLTQVTKKTQSIVDNQPSGRYFIEAFFSKGTTFNVSNLEENVKATLCAIDIQREINMGITKDGLTPIKGNEVAISRTLARNLNLQVGQNFNMELKDLKLSERMIEEYRTMTRQPTAQLPNIEVIVQFKIISILDNFIGRFQDRDKFERVVALQSNQFLKFVGLEMMKKYQSNQASINYKYSKWIETQLISEFSEEIIVNFQDREELYLAGNYITLLEQAVPNGAKIIEKLGYNAIEVDMPLVEAMSITRFANTFISITLNLVVIGLLYMASYVIFNLMLITVDTRIYETAVQRVLGLNKYNMVAMMATNGLLFSAFGLVIGLPLTAGILSYVNNLLEGMDAGFTIDYSVKNAFIAIAIAVGIPQFASITPIRNLLKQGISSSLDSDHSKTSSMKIDISNETKRFPINSFSAATFSIFMGISIYFMLPLALLTLDIGLFVIIFFGLLICLLLGSLLLAINFNYLVEEFLLLFLFFEKRYMKKLIRMNLISHRLRNRRTVVIYALGLAFINFIFVSFFMQIQSQQTGGLRRNGAEIVMDSDFLTMERWKVLLKELDLQKMITYAYRSAPIQDYLEPAQFNQPTFENHGQIVRYNSWAFAVSPNFPESTKTYLSEIHEYGNYGLDPYELMYTREGNGGAIMGESVYERMQLNTMDRDSTFLMKYSNQTVQEKKQLFPIASYTRGVAFRYTGRPGSQSNNFVMSIPQFYSILPPNAKFSFTTSRMDKIWIKLRPEYKNKFDEVLEKIESRSFRESYNVWNYAGFVDRFSSTQDILNIMFVFITSIAMGLSLFSLVSTMASNIFEQVKELGVMRCIGLTRFQIARVFWYESMIVILSGGIIGLTVGMLIGWTIIAQTSLFSNGEIELVFPTQLFFTVIFFSIIASFFAGGIPAFRFLRTGITKLVKGI